MAEISASLYRAGEGPPLVLLHGFMGTWRHWQPVLAELVARFEVIAPTLAGHDGGPPFPGDVPATLAGAGDSLERHLDELGVERAHLVGNSMGGALAIELAKRDRALSVVAIAPAGGWDPASREPRRLHRFFVRQRRLARAAAPRLPMLMSRSTLRHVAFREVMRHGERIPPVEAVHMVRAAIRCSVAGLALESLRSGRGHLDKLEEVAAPVLVAWPQLDRVLPIDRHTERCRKEVPGVEFLVMPGVGHVPMWDDPGLVVATISEFVGAHAESPGTRVAATQ